MASNRKLRAAAFFALLFSSLHAQCQTWIPKNDQVHIMSLSALDRQPDEISVAVSAYNDSLTLDLNTIIRSELKLLQVYQQYASRPGFSHLNLKAKQLWDKLYQRYQQNQSSFTQDSSAQMLLIKAKLMQQQHLFDESLQWLQKIESSSALFTQAKLIEARISLLNGQHDYAKKACTKLIAHSNLMITQLCFIDLQVSQGKALSSALANQLAQAEKSSKKQSQIISWINSINAEIALQNNQLNQAIDYFSQSLETANTSQWLGWADTSLSANQAQKVLNKITLLAKGKTLDDNLLLRAARAEKMIGNDQYWQKMIEQRIQLRELRKDKLHASDLAYYYIYLNNNPAKAKYWAQINWQQVKELADKRLLMVAQSSGDK